MAVDFEIVEIETQASGLAEADRTLLGIADRLDDMHGVLEQGLRDFADHTRNWMEAWGDGTWDALDPSTIADKAAAGHPDPMRPLYATGEMFRAASEAPPVIPGVTSMPPDISIWDVTEHIGSVALDWDRGGYQIPVLHQEGVPERMVHRRAYTRKDGTYVQATSYMWHLPGRPIFTITDGLVDEIGGMIEAHVFNPIL